MRQEFGPNDAAKGEIRAEGQQSQSDANRNRSVTQAPIQTTLISLHKHQQQRVALFTKRLAEKIAGQNRREKERKEQCAQERKRHRPRHGTKESAFHALQGENRQVGDDDDQDRKKDRSLYFVRSPADPVSY